MTQPCPGQVSLCARAGRILGEMGSLERLHVPYRETVNSLDSSGLSPGANQNPSVFRSATKGQGFGSHLSQERSPAPAKHQHLSLPSLKLARGPVWKSLFFLGSCTYPTCAALARCHHAVSAQVARWRFGGVFLWVGCLRALGAASFRGMDGSLAISMQKEGFPGVLFCLGFHPLQLGRYLFTWLSRVLSDHHHCERQFQLPGSHPQGISDKPTTPHTTHHTPSRPCLANVYRCRGWWVREGIQTQYRRH